MENKQIKELINLLIVGNLSSFEIRKITEEIYILGYQEAISESIKKLDKI